VSCSRSEEVVARQPEHEQKEVARWREQQLDEVARRRQEEVMARQPEHEQEEVARWRQEGCRWRDSESNRWRWRDGDRRRWHNGDRRRWWRDSQSPAIVPSVPPMLSALE